MNEPSFSGDNHDAHLYSGAPAQGGISLVLRKSLEFLIKVAPLVAYVSLMVSLLASFVSVLIYLDNRQSRMPDIDVTFEGAKVYANCNEGAGESELWALVHYEIDNDSEATSLKNISRPKTVNPVEAKSTGPRKFPAKAVLLVPSTINQTPVSTPASELEQVFKDGENATRALPNYEKTMFSVPVNGVIEQGARESLILGFQADVVQDGKQIKRFILNLEFRFSNGKSHIVKARIEVPHKESWPCSFS